MFSCVCSYFKRAYGVVAFCLVFSTAASSQVKMFMDATDKLLTEAQYEKRKLEHWAKMRGKVDSIKLVEELIPISERGDTTTYGFIWHMVLGNTASLERKITSRARWLGKPFPDMPLLDLQGNTVSAEQWKGKPVMINFWFTQCKPCVDEMPVLARLSNEFAGKVQFVAINYQPADTVHAFLQKHDFPFLQIVSAQPLLDSLLVETFPRNYFLDSAGRLRRMEGGIPYEMKGKKMVMGSGEKFREYLHVMTGKD